jgi:hypothetical protein
LYGDVLGWKEVEEEEHSWEACGDSELGRVSPGDLHLYYRYLSSLEEFARAPRAHRPNLASWLLLTGSPVSSSFLRPADWTQRVDASL